jgi:hypothetical protein
MFFLGEKFMKLLYSTLLAAWAVGVSVPAHAAKSCDELKAAISAKLDGKQVSGYKLDVIAADATDERKVVGTCAGGSKKIVYAKSGKHAKASKAAPAAAASAASR